MTSYIVLAHIHLTAAEEKYVTGNIAKPGGLLHTGRISTLQQPPVLVVTKIPGGSETTSSTGEKRFCLTPI